MFLYVCFSCHDGAVLRVCLFADSFPYLHYFRHRVRSIRYFHLELLGLPAGPPKPLEGHRSIQPGRSVKRGLRRLFPLSTAMNEVRR